VFVPAGQSTQLIVGATPESDQKIVSLAQGLYDKYALKRVFYSAYTPVVSGHPILPATRAPLLREHRLYQADWLLRYYHFRAEELLEEGQNLDLNMDPKCNWAINNLDKFPVEINTAEYETLLRVPGIGVRSATKILISRRTGRLDFETLRKMRIVLKRAKYFITCGGRMYQPVVMKPETLTIALSENKINEAYEQLTLDMLLRREGQNVRQAITDSSL
jgi:predicted DNA-binding helix-hairpin-helix protein